MGDYACGHIRCEPYDYCQLESAPGDLLAELDEAERVMSQCGAPYKPSRGWANPWHAPILPGLACELSEEHDGAHQSCVPVTWPREAKGT